MNLWQNARDCGFGQELITVYPALTDEQLAQHTTVGFYNSRNDESDRFDCWFDRENVRKSTTIP